MLFMACGKDCSKARMIFDKWRQTEEAANPKLKYFIDSFYMAQDAIEHREGKPRKLTTICDLSDAKCR